MYLEMLTEFSPFHRIAHLLKKFATKFLRLSGLYTGETRDTNQKKRPRSSSSVAASETSLRSKGSSNSRYLEHSQSVSNSIADSSDSRSLQRSSQALSEVTDNTEVVDVNPNYVTWWDPNLKQAFYIDPRTGSS